MFINCLHFQGEPYVLKTLFYGKTNSAHCTRPVQCADAFYVQRVLPPKAGVLDCAQCEQEEAGTPACAEAEGAERSEEEQLGVSDVYSLGCCAGVAEQAAVKAGEAAEGIGFSKAVGKVEVDADVELEEIFFLCHIRKSFKVFV